MTDIILNLFVCSLSITHPWELPAAQVPARYSTAPTGNEMRDSAAYDSDCEANHANWDEAVARREIWWYNLPGYVGQPADTSHINPELGF